MPYIRRDTKKVSGEDVTYLSIAHNVVERPEDGKPRSKPIVMANLGREDQLDEDRVDGLIAALHRYKQKRFGSTSDEVARLAQEVREKESALRVLASREFGFGVVVDHVWRESGLREAFHRIALQHRLTWDLERVVFGMVLHRLFDPGSKLSCNEWLREEAWFPEVEGLDVHHFYRALDLLEDHHDEVADAVARSMALRLTDDERRLLLLDTTSTYFETDTEEDDGLRRRGHSKDHRPDKAQVVVGMVADVRGRPIRHAVFPGNTSDQSVTKDLIREAAADVEGGRVVVAADSGLSGKPNLRALDKLGVDRVTGVPVRSSKVAEELVLSTPGRWAARRGKAGRTFRAVFVPAAVNGTERDEVWVATRHEDTATRQRRDLDRKVARVKAALARDRGIDDHGRPTCKLLATPALARLVKPGTRKHLILNQDAIHHERRLAGVKVVRSTLVDLEAEESLDAYEALQRLEQDWRLMKGPLALRPVYHHAPRRIRAHVAVCVLAVAVARELEEKTGRSITHLRRVLRPVRAQQIERGESRHWQRCAWDGEAAEVLSAMGITPGPVVLDGGVDRTRSEGTPRGEARR